MNSLVVRLHVSTGHLFQSAGQHVAHEDDLSNLVEDRERCKMDADDFVARDPGARRARRARGERFAGMK